MRCGMRLMFLLLQRIDSMMCVLADGLKELETKQGVKYLICVTGDHSTPVDYGDHRCCFVPSCSPSVRPNLGSFSCQFPAHLIAFCCQLLALIVAHIFASYMLAFHCLSVVSLFPEPVNTTVLLT